MKSNFVKNITKLAGGTSLAQLLNIISIPILARLYSPEDFGYLAICSATVAILSVFTTLKYENAIIVLDRDTDAQRCVSLIYIISLIVAFLSFIFTLLTFSIYDFDGKYFFECIVLAILMSVFVALNQALYYLNNRNQNYSVMTKGRVLGAFVVFLVSVTLHYLIESPLGLIMGVLSGSICNFYYQLKYGVTTNLKLNLRVIYSSKLIGKKLSRFPKFLVPSNFFDRLSSQMHIFIFAKFFQPQYLGALNLHNKVIRLPSSIIGNSIRDVFKKEANDQLKMKKNCLKLFVKTTGCLVFISVIPFLLLNNYGEYIYVIVFGEKWRVAGQFAESLSILFFISFVVSPVSSLIYLGENQRYDLLNQIILILLLVVFFIIAIPYNDPFIALNAFIAAYIIKYCIEFIVSYNIAKGEK